MIFKKFFILFLFLFEYYSFSSFLEEKAETNFSTLAQKDEGEQKNLLIHQNKEILKNQETINNFFQYATNAKKNLKSLKSSFIDQNELPLLFFSGLGCGYLSKEYGKSFFKPISWAIGTWTALHSLFLITINKNNDNIKNILIPFRAEKLKKEDCAFSDNLEAESDFFPILSFLKRKYFSNQEKTNELREKIIIVCKNNFAPISFFCFGIFFRLLKQSPIKKLTYYVIFQELLLATIFLSKKENRTLKKYKNFLLDHINPASEIGLQLTYPELKENNEKDKYSVELKKNIKISPFLSFIYEILLQIKLMPDAIGEYNTEHIITELHEWLTEYFKKSEKLEEPKELEELKQELIGFSLEVFKEKPIKNRTTVLNIKDVLEKTTID